MLYQRLAPYLKPLLFLDAASCTVFAIALLSAGPTLSRLLAIPELWLFHGGVICAVSALLALWLATRDVVPARGVLLIVVGNIAWGIISVAAVLMGWISPNPLGALVTVGQGVAVLVLGELEYLALRGRSSSVRLA